MVIGSCTADTDNYAMRQACLSALTAIEADPGLLARLCTCDRACSPFHSPPPSSLALALTTSCPCSPVAG